MTPAQKVQLLSALIVFIFTVLGIFGIQIDIPVVSPEFPVK